jgi:DNA-binding transcriptional MerR regulator
MKSYSIQMTSFLSGVSPDCIRAWERRYGAIVPDRDKGRRVFDDTDVSRLLMLKELSAIGNPISTVAKLSDEELIKLCDEVGIQTTPKMGSEQVKYRHPDEFTEVITLAFDNKRMDILHHELQKASDELSGVDFANSIMSYLIHRLKTSSFSELQKKIIHTLFRSIMMKKISKKGETEIVVSYLACESNELKALNTALIMTSAGLNITFAGECEDVEVLIETAKITGARIISVESSGVAPYKISQCREKVESLMWKGEFIFVDPMNPLEGKVKNS